MVPEFNYRPSGQSRPLLKPSRQPLFPISKHHLSTIHNRKRPDSFSHPFTSLSPSESPVHRGAVAGALCDPRTRCFFCSVQMDIIAAVRGWVQPDFRRSNRLPIGCRLACVWRWCRGYIRHGFRRRRPPSKPLQTYRNHSFLSSGILLDARKPLRPSLYMEHPRSIRRFRQESRFRCGQSLPLSRLSHLMTKQ